ncbi:MAG: hypothetical protein NUV81_02810 [bacterium]|nr:hypothetical protein [bacterium]
MPLECTPLVVQRDIEWALCLMGFNPQTAEDSRPTIKVEACDGETIPVSAPPEGVSDFFGEAIETVLAESRSSFPPSGDEGVSDREVNAPTFGSFINLALFLGALT